MTRSNSSARLMYTCSLDVIDDYPDGLSEGSVALLLGVSHQAINAETRTAMIKFRAGLKVAWPGREGQ